MPLSWRSRLLECKTILNQISECLLCQCRHTNIKTLDTSGDNRKVQIQLTDFIRKVLVVEHYSVDSLHCGLQWHIRNILFIKHCPCIWTLSTTVLGYKQHNMCYIFSTISKPSQDPSSKLAISGHLSLWKTWLVWILLNNKNIWCDPIPTKLQDLLPVRQEWKTILLWSQLGVLWSLITFSRLGPMMPAADFHDRETCSANAKG